MSDVADTSAAEIAAALDHVGARLKHLRSRRRMTLTGVAGATGISKSTLSRLESGQRRPTLELLLALSHTRTCSSRPATSPPSTPRCRTGSAAPATNRLRSSASSGAPTNG